VAKLSDTAIGPFLPSFTWNVTSSPGFASLPHSSDDWKRMSFPYFSLVSGHSTKPQPFEGL